MTGRELPRRRLLGWLALAPLAASGLPWARLWAALPNCRPGRGLPRAARLDRLGRDGRVRARRRLVPWQIDRGDRLAG